MVRCEYRRNAMHEWHHQRVRHTFLEIYHQSGYSQKILAIAAMGYSGIHVADRTTPSIEHVNSITIWAVPTNLLSRNAYWLSWHVRHSFVAGRRTKRMRRTIGLFNRSRSIACNWLFGFATKLTFKRFESSKFLRNLVFNIFTKS